LGDRWGEADATMTVGIAFGEGGDWAGGLPLIKESVELFRELGDMSRLMWGTRTLAWAHAGVNDLHHARPLFEDALRQAREADNRLFEAVVLGSLSWLALVE